MAPHPDPTPRAAAPAAARRRYEATERMAGILAAQRELGEREMDVRGLQESVAHRASQLTRAAGALLEVVEGAQLVARAASGLLAPLAERRSDVSRAPSLRSVRGSSVHRSDDATNDPLVDPAFVAREARSVLSVPLRHDERVVGVLTVVAPDAAAFDDFDALTLQFLASVVAQGMDRWAQYKARHQLLDERSLAVRARHVSDERFHVLFRDAPVGLAVLGDDLEVHDANDALCALAQLSRDELLFRHFPDLLQREDGMPGVAPQQSGEDFRARLVRRDGSTAHVHLRLRPLPASPGETPRVLAVVEDLEHRATRAPAPKEAPPKEAAPQLAVHRVDLAPALTRSLRAFQAFAVRNGVRVEARLAPALFVRGDPSLLEYAVRSVVENVVRSAKAHGTILAQGAVTGGAVIIQFSGSAILPERVAALFQSLRPEPFTFYAGRDGLGLDEAHRIVSLHGGQLWWRQTPQGTVLGLSLAAAT